MTQETPLQDDQGLQPPPPAAVPGRPARGRRRVRRALVALFTLAVLLAILCAIGVFGGNVHAIIPGRVYRSAQLTGNNYTAITAAWVGHDFDSVVKAHHIKTVLNLRGGSSENDYYRTEVQDCEQLGVTHVDVPFSARHLPSPEVMRRLLNTFDHARYPLLLHCQAGADRTGLVSALYLNIYGHVPLDQAVDRELTWRHGHFSITKTRAMDRFFELYRQTGQGLTLRQWIETVYPSVYTRETGLPATIAK